jgi:hypothetical protein
MLAIIALILIAIVALAVLGFAAHVLFPPLAAGGGPDGHGMILIESGVDLEDTTYRVIQAGLDPRRAPGLER